MPYTVTLSDEDLEAIDAILECAILEVPLGDLMHLSNRQLDRLGINPWCINEGRATREDTVDLSDRLRSIADRARASKESKEGE